MKKTLNTGNFFIPESNEEPIILFIFNQFQDDIEDVYLNIEDDIVNINYLSGDVLALELNEDSKDRIIERITHINKIIVAEIDENDGDVAALYEAELKNPA